MINDETKQALQDFLLDGDYSQQEQRELTFRIEAVLLNEPSEESL